MRQYQNVAVFRIKEAEVNLVNAAYGEQGFTIATVVEDLPNGLYTIFYTKEINSEEHTNRKV